MHINLNTNMQTDQQIDGLNTPSTSVDSTASIKYAMLKGMEGAIMQAITPIAQPNYNVVTPVTPVSSTDPLPAEVELELQAYADVTRLFGMVDNALNSGTNDPNIASLLQTLNGVINSTGFSSSVKADILNALDGLTGDPSTYRTFWSSYEQTSGPGCGAQLALKWLQANASALANLYPSPTDPNSATTWKDSMNLMFMVINLSQMTSVQQSGFPLDKLIFGGSSSGGHQGYMMGSEISTYFPYMLYYYSQNFSTESWSSLTDGLNLSGTGASTPNWNKMWTSITSGTPPNPVYAGGESYAQWAQTANMSQMLGYFTGMAGYLAGLIG